uniref:Metalloendopeptidase n=1 Tax=Gouania willdenowi TaxID=441366 RepID=A0A8C5DY39_GOUWI
LLLIIIICLLMLMLSPLYRTALEGPSNTGGRHSFIYSRTEQMTSAMAMISKDTCLSFHKRTIEDDYLLFQTGKGCASYVGFIGGEQPVFIGSRCIVGNIVHEILHALGFQHEHTRLDRENYITIFAENIIDRSLTGMEKNFKKHNGETFSLPYDIQSILHYGRQFFSANGKPTIIANEYEGPMGQRANLTWTDIEKVRKLYRCGELC